jgi:hypothetical protein
MRTAIEHAGAERGLLIFLRDTELRVEAEARTDDDTIVVNLGEACVTGCYGAGVDRQLFGRGRSKDPAPGRR